MLELNFSSFICDQTWIFADHVPLFRSSHACCIQDNFIGSNYLAPQFAVWILGFIWKPNFLGHMATLSPIVLQQIKAPPIMRCPCFHALPFFRVSSENFCAKWFKILPIPHWSCSPLADFFFQSGYVSSIQSSCLFNYFESGVLL